MMICKYPRDVFVKMKGEDVPIGVKFRRVSHVQRELEEKYYDAPFYRWYHKNGTPTYWGVSKKYPYQLKYRPTFGISRTVAQADVLVLSKDMRRKRD